jgi:hypothetical protein
MPRLTTGLFVGLTFTLISGCRDEPRPASPDLTVVADEPPSLPSKPVHELDPARHTIPTGPVSGTVAGEDFTAEAIIDGDYLMFRAATPGHSSSERKVWLELRGPGQTVENRKLIVRPETVPGPEVPRIFIEAPTLPRPEFYSHGYAMTLELGQRKGNKLPGRIYLCFPDEKSTVLAGTFEANYPRLPTDPPGIDDVPFINGSVTLRNVDPRHTLRVGYLGVVGAELFVLGSGDLEMDPTAPPNRSIQVMYDKPRVTSLIAGDGHSIPHRYEHSRLTPGRYLVFAMVPDGGPMAWKWVTIKSTTTTTVDFTLDPLQTGGLEVGAPLEALGKVHLVPLDEQPTAGLLNPTISYAIALHLRLEQDIVARKALFKNLAPGKYEVRAGGQIRYVEVVAGKTVELDFDKKPTPLMK